MKSAVTVMVAGALGLALIVISTLQADARGSGACDGFHRCRCGTTAARRHGISYAYNGFNLKRAVEWVRAFPRTGFGSGVVAYIPRGGPSGHVMTVESGPDCAHATVSDDKGTYQRNVCGATFVSPSGGSNTALAYANMPEKQPPQRHKGRKGWRHSPTAQQVAQAPAFDRLTPN